MVLMQNVKNSNQIFYNDNNDINLVPNEHSENNKYNGKILASIIASKYIMIRSHQLACTYDFS